MIQTYHKCKMTCIGTCVAFSTLSQKYSEYPHKNRAFHGLISCNVASMCHDICKQMPGICPQKNYLYRREGQGRRCCLGKLFIQFNAALAILRQDDLKKRVNSSFSSYHPDAIHPFLQNILVQNS